MHMSLTWLSNTIIKKPNIQNPTERGEENQVRQRERESMPFKTTAKLFSTVSPPLFWQRLGAVQSGYVSPLPSSDHLSSSIRCQPKPQAPSLHRWPISVFVFLFRYGFRHLCLCFRVDFGLCLCFGMGFGVGFGLCLHFGFVSRAWVLASLCVSGWVFASCSQFVGFDLGCSYFYPFFSSFSDLGFAHISTHFFFGFSFLFFFFCSSSLVLDGFWS